MREVAQRPAHLERALDVRALLHVDPQHDAAAPGFLGEREQVRAAARRIDVESKLRQLHRDVAVERARAHLLGDGDVVLRGFFGGRGIRDVLAESREHRAEALPLQCRRRCQGVLQPFARHEAADRAADERQRRDVVAQPGVLRCDEQGAAHDPHQEIVHNSGLFSPAGALGYLYLPNS